MLRPLNCDRPTIKLIVSIVKTCAPIVPTKTTDVGKLRREEALTNVNNNNININNNKPDIPVKSGTKKTVIQVNITIYWYRSL